MSNDTPKDELVVSVQKAVKIEEIEGKKVARFSVDPLLQGHTFSIELTPSGDETPPTGPFRIEYVLGSEFVIHENKLPLISLEEGYSHLIIGPEFANIAITLKYIDDRGSNVTKEAALSIKSTEGVVQRFVVETPEIDLSLAVRYTGQIVADLLDALSFIKKVPIAVRHIEVHALGGKHQRRYVTLPYGHRQLNTQDIAQTITILSRLRAALRLFREGLSSNKPHYRLLCLYRVREVLESVRRQNDQEVIARGGTPDRPSRVLPDNKLTRSYFPNHIGKKVGSFLDHVRSDYRLPVAHGNMDEYFKLILDPANVQVEHRVDYTNAALIPVIAELIKDEIDFIARYELSS
ncbi:MAG: hypothetical protein MPW14_16635 [Candidatus Manganitrophus sp.]|nr:hypothetical protein [Candidatus Manganitrophus sp.]WDT69606.1 MAG: hypothetical protein MPW17_12525 [Candidatus Manganitrophus sp.]WDT74176.1 MAG: hypothetical protein MPW16_13015 [Candidatus Manganitrophus sp.]WDT78793.1 MAG: hypothetical protein MPW14_16635 [Candidatus Manganitrophus sp.]